MGAMENAVHAKSYSNIFMTYMSNQKIDELFLWGEKHTNLQNIMSLIVGYYKELDRYNYLKQFESSDPGYSETDFNIAQYKAMVASVYLETWLFYSGFYYPLFFYGQGKLMQAGEIINLILSSYHFEKAITSLRSYPLSLFHLNPLGLGRQQD